MKVGIFTRNHTYEYICHSIIWSHATRKHQESLVATAKTGTSSTNSCAIRVKNNSSWEDFGEPLFYVSCCVEKVCRQTANTQNGRGQTEHSKSFLKIYVCNFEIVTPFVHQEVTSRLKPQLGFVQACLNDGI